MQGIWLTSGVIAALLTGALACARHEETGAAKVGDSAAAEVANPPGYQGMERDTTVAPPREQQPVDTFLQQQGTNPTADTLGYSGAEQDTTGRGRTDSTGMSHDSTRLHGDTTTKQRPSDTVSKGDTSRLHGDSTRETP